MIRTEKKPLKVIHSTRIAASATARRRAAIALALAIAVLSLLVTSGASAFTRPYICQITGSKTPSASECNGAGNTIPVTGKGFSEPTFLALDGSDNLWVDDLALGRVDKFDPAGNFLAQGGGDEHLRKGQIRGGMAYGDTAAHLYVGEEFAEPSRAGVWVLNSDASFSSAFEPPELIRSYAVAADNSGTETDGDLYVGGDEPPTEFGTTTSIRRYDAAGNPDPFSAAAPYIEGNRLHGVAPVNFSAGGPMTTDAEGNLYVAGRGESEVLEFARSGLYLRTFIAPPVKGSASGVAIDPTNGDLLVIFFDGTVDEWDSSGALLGQITGTGTESFSKPWSIAVDSTGRLYVADTGHKVIDVFGAPISTPTVTTGEASPVAKHSATLNATVNPEGAPLSECVFQWGETSSYGQSVPCAESPGEIGSGSTAVAVHADLTGLKPETGYHFRLKVTNAKGPFEGEDKAFQTPVAVTLQTGNATEVTVASATLNGTVDPQGELVEECHFDYGLGDAFDQSIPCTPAPGAGSGNVAVKADISGLSSGLSYSFRLIATNSDGTTEGFAATFETPAAVKLETGEASEVTSASATLNGTVDPQGEAVTQCSFQYGTDFALDRSAPCSPEPGAGSGDVALSAALSGLLPGQTYQFRLAAASSLGQTTGAIGVFTTPLLLPAAGACPNAALRAGASAALPDCRAYELISPPDKKGSDVVAMPTRTRIADDGAAVQFSSLGAFADLAGAGVASEYIATRSAAPATSGWATHAITPGNLEPTSLNEIVTSDFQPRYMGEFSPDLNRGFFTSNTPLTADSPNTDTVPGLYLRNDLRSAGQGSYQLLSSCPACSAPLPPNVDGKTEFDAASADFSHVLFESKEPLTADAGGCALPYRGNCPVRLFESSGGVVRLAGILPASEGGGPAPNSEAGWGGRNGHPYTNDTISADGSRLIFTAALENSSEGRLYQRIDNGLPDARTVQLNASERSLPAAPKDAKFWAASADATRVFFATKESLLDSGGSGLYMWSATPGAGGHHLSLISKSEGGIASFSAVLGASEDGRTVYFLNDGQLLPGQPPIPAGQSGIFRWHDGNLRFLTSIFAVTPLLRPDWVYGQPARVTPDGNHLLFLSAGTDLLPHSGAADSCTTAADSGGSDAPRCRELFLYDATANQGEGELVCASCFPGEPEAPLHSGAGFELQAFRSGAAKTAHRNHPLSADGRFVFFDTTEALVPEDTNGVLDVYEYDSQTGEQHLISSGESKFPSYFTDATPSGSDALFVTAEPITGWDLDGNTDLYDARVGGGLPEPPPPPPSCTGDACQPPPLVLNDPTPGSASFSGPGNPKAAKQHKRRHHKKQAKKHHVRAKHNRGARR